MASKAPDPSVQWLVLTCPSCQAKSRLPATAASRGARCPRCRACILEPQAQPESRLKAGPAPEADADDSQEADEPSSAEVAFDDRDLELRLPPPNLYWLMWKGVYGFPWYLHNLLRWFLYGLGFSLV